MNKDKKQTEKKETVDTMETVLFTELNVQLIRRSSVRSMVPILSIIANDWNLKLNNANHFKIANRILIRSVKCN